MTEKIKNFLETVPLSLLFAIATQTGIGIWWAAQQSAKLSAMAEDLHELQSRVTLDSAVRDVATRNQVTIEVLSSRIRSIERKIDRHLDPSP